jgi:hypothetical protein
LVRKLSSETKARGRQTRQRRAELKQQLEAGRQKIAEARERFAEAMMQQTAIPEMLRLTSNSPIGDGTIDLSIDHRSPRW